MYHKCLKLVKIDYQYFLITQGLRDCESLRGCRSHFAHIFVYIELVNFQIQCIKLRYPNIVQRNE